MVPIITGLLIIVAIALIAVSGMPNVLKSDTPPIRQLTMESFVEKVPAVSTAPPTAKLQPGASTPASTEAPANLSKINITNEATSRADAVYNMIDHKQSEDLTEKYMNGSLDATTYINQMWNQYLKIQSKYDKTYPNSTTQLIQVFAATAKIAGEMYMQQKDKATKTRGEELLLALKTWLPPQAPAPPLPPGAPTSNLPSTPAPADKTPLPPVSAPPAANNIGNQYSLATITLPTIPISNNTVSLASPSQPLPVNMVQLGPAPAIVNGDMDRIITKLVKEELKAELKNIGRADKPALMRKKTPGLSQGTDFKKQGLPDYKGTPINPNAASSDGGYNHLGPLGEYQDSFHPPLMPDGGYYDPRIYVRKDSVPCYGCSLDY
jgi:hypothetical protein